MDAYLAEGRSIGGLSGSPIFVRNTVVMPIPGPKGKVIYSSGLGAIHFLGLMHGHWEVPGSFSTTEQAEAVNMGVSIIVPAKKILEVLYHPELVALRKENVEEQKRSKYPTMNSSFSAKPLSKEEFEAMLKKVSRKKSDQK